MKGVNNRQKMVVRPREDVQKFVFQKKTIRRVKILNQSGFRKREPGKKSR